MDSTLLIVLLSSAIGFCIFALPILLVKWIHHRKEQDAADMAAIEAVLASLDEPEASEKSKAGEEAKEEEAVPIPVSSPRPRTRPAAKVADSYAVGKAASKVASSTKTVQNLSRNPNTERYKAAQDKAAAVMREQREKAESERKKRWEEQKKKK